MERVGNRPGSAADAAVAATALFLSSPSTYTKCTSSSSSSTIAAMREPRPAFLRLASTLTKRCLSSLLSILAAGSPKLRVCSSSGQVMRVLLRLYTFNDVDV